MQYFQVKSFRGIETKEEATDQDRTVARECSGLLNVPQGALSNGPQWQLLWGITDLPARIAVALASANAAKTHFVRLSRGGRVFLIAWSVPQSRCLGFFEVASVLGDQDLDSTDGVTVLCPGYPYMNKDSSAQWYASRIGTYWILGNGIDDNILVNSGVLKIFGPQELPKDINDRSRFRIPPCTSFRLNDRRNLFAAGNAAQPMRVWVTASPTEPYPFITGLQSLERDFIDVHPHGGSTRITALSLFTSYITVHTDAAPINLYGVDNTSDGWKCQQSGSSANASAISPACVGDVMGDASFYLGTDLEVYTDQAVRSGPWEKRTARDQDIVTAQAAEVWNRDMLPQDGSLDCRYSVIYDVDTRLFWIFAPTSCGLGMLWAYYERTRAIVGPIHYPDAVASTVLGRLRVPLFEGVGVGIGTMEITTSFIVT